MEYKDKDGKILYGYSQTSLDKQTRRLNILNILFALSLATVWFMLWYIAKKDILTRVAGMGIGGKKWEIR